ncbi:glycosyltransferase [Flavobacterium crassostreae]|uniref:Alpha-1,4-N-acetylgalactosamine transferase n=1 Tax=Flavobacterium crassostreae TaxID=1763534 RepID=A0A1B9E3N3_9FLAO|nr:glycosyltransferase [Flavobacterium crassostreae]OCB76537.1 alpha-1,4-N-acetylgalactosamine transferase [Flavobacterium crassostreae]
MRIVQIIDSLEAGGAERIAVQYANALSDKIAFSGLVVTRKEGPLLKTIAKNCSYLFLAKKKAMDWKAILKLRNYIRHNKVAMVHAHGTSFFTAVLLKISCPSIKIIWHEHYGARQDQSTLNNLRIVFCSLFFRAIFVVNKPLVGWVKQKLFCKKVFYIPNFAVLDLEKTPSTVLKGTKGKRIVCVANLKDPKNHLALLVAFESLELSALGWSLHFVGKDYQDNYSDTLKDFLVTNNLSESVFLYGLKKDISSILAQATIGVLASTSEGFPVSLLEYGLIGLPTLCANVGACSEIIKNTTTGLLFDPNNTEDLKNQLHKIISDVRSRNQFGVSLQQLVLKEYSPETVLKQLIARYEEIQND